LEESIAKKKIIGEEPEGKQSKEGVMQDKEEAKLPFVMKK
jgi:hypothetical protein